MNIEHKMTNVPGGNKVVSVTEYSGMGLVKVTLIPTSHAKQNGLTMKQLVQLIESSHEKYLRDAIRKLEAQA